MEALTITSDIRSEKMSPKERRSKIYEYLRTFSNWVTVKKLSQDFNVSIRTIYNDLDKIDDDLKDTRWSIEKKRGVGVRLNSAIVVSENNEYHAELDDRKVIILERLLIKNEIVTLVDLSDSFFVSTSSIKNDLDIIRELIETHTNVKLTSDNNGTQVVGNEGDIRGALIWFNQYILENQNSYKQSDLNFLKTFLKHHYNETLVDVAYDILFDFVQTKNNILSDYYILNTLNVYIVQLHRLILNCELEEDTNSILNIDFVEEIHTVDEFTSGADELLSRAAARLSMNYSQYEVEYLTKHLILNRLENLPVEATNKELIEELISHLSNTLRVDLNEDPQLEKQLTQHVPPMLYRLKLNVKLQNPFVTQIKSDFGETFHTIKLAIDSFEKKLNIQFDDEEIALLTIYFQSAIERKKQLQKVLVVCQHGLAMSELLINRIENIIPYKLNIQSSSIGELKYYNLNNYDLVLSTVDSLEGKNILNVSTFLNENDIVRINEHLSSKSKLSQRIQDVNEPLLAYLDTRYIYINTDYKDKESLLNEVLRKLLDEKYITQNYIMSLFDREKIGSTDLPVGSSIPHGSSDFVNKSVVVIIYNKKKIKWSKFYVDKVFIPLISKEDKTSIKPIIKAIYNIIDDEDILNNFSDYLYRIKERL